MDCRAEGLQPSRPDPQSTHAFLRKGVRLKVKKFVRALFAPALALTLAVTILCFMGCSTLVPTRPASAPATDKGTPPPFYQPGLSDEVAETQAADQTGSSGGEMENLNEPIAPKI